MITIVVSGDTLVAGINGVQLRGSFDAATGNGSLHTVKGGRQSTVTFTRDSFVYHGDSECGIVNWTGARQ